MEKFEKRFFPVEIKNGDIILRHTLGWAPMAWSICRLINSFFGHGGVAVIDSDGDIYVIEADPPVVKKTPILEFVNPKKYIIKIITLREEAFLNKTEYELAIDHAVNFLRLKIGSRYDKKAIIWLALCYTILPILRKFKKNGFQNRLEFFCFELICQAFHGTSSIIKYLFAGIKYPEAECGQITSRDIGKTVNVQFKAGKNVL